MSAGQARTAPQLRVAHPIGAQRATSDPAAATPGATSSATEALRAAARAALARNKGRNAERNDAENGRNSEPPKPAPELRPGTAVLDAVPAGALPPTPDTVADLERGRRLLDRLRWTRRHVGLGPDGVLVVRPRVGTADPFGREVAAHPDDIAAVLAAEAAGAVA